MNIEIINANNMKLKPNLIKRISRVTLEEENLSFRSTELVASSIENGFFQIAVNKSSDILGWLENYKIWKSWWVISNLYVLPEYRGRGVGRKLLTNQSVKGLKNKKIFIATTNKKLYSSLEKLGFNQIGLNEIPIYVKLNLAKRYINIRSLLSLLNLRTKGFRYFVKLEK